MGVLLGTISLLYLAVVSAVHIHFTCYSSVAAGSSLNTRARC